jgi:hypothetical protein
MIRYHFIILVTCSCAGFAGHYIQFGVFRLTAWIPAMAGLFALVLKYALKNSKGYLKYLPLFFILLFGILTAIMCIRFLPQPFQPLRKKIIFCVMSISALVTVIHDLKYMYLTGENDNK